jgi:outer membrane protein assembly factor BamB
MYRVPFLWSDTGILTCVDVSNGNAIWTHRVTGDYSSSPVIINDKLVNVSADGVVRIVRASRSFELLGEIPLDQTVRSTIVPLEKNLLIRTETDLVVVDAP